VARARPLDSSTLLSDLRPPAGQGAAQERAAMDDALQPQPCPKCGATLAYVRREGQLLEVCTACRGVWFDPGELTLLIEVYRKVDDVGGKPSGASCPRCRAGLLEVAFPGTPVL